MDPINQNPAIPGDAAPSSAPSSPEPSKTPIGPIAGAIIIILLLVAGGLYFWGAKLNSELQQEPLPLIQGDGAVIEGDLSSDTSAGLPAQSSSDDISSIEADANAINLTQLESQNSADLEGI